MKFLRIKYGIDSPEEDPDRDTEITRPESANANSKVEGHPPTKSSNIRSFNVYIDDTLFKVEVDPTDQNSIAISDGIKTQKNNDTKPSVNGPAKNSDGQLQSPMPGVILRYLVEVGQEVKQGEPVAVLEAMKMENTLPAPKNGSIQSLHVEPGQTVSKGDLLAIIM